VKDFKAMDFIYFYWDWEQQAGVKFFKSMNPNSTIKDAFKL